MIRKPLIISRRKDGYTIVDHDGSPVAILFGVTDHPSLLKRAEKMAAAETMFDALDEIGSMVNMENDDIMDLRVEALTAAGGPI